MTGLVFVDTNVIVYSRDLRDPAKQEAALQWMARLWEHNAGRLSSQVLYEYYVTVTRKLSPGMTVAEARTDVRALSLWLVTTAPGSVLEAAWALQDRYRLSFWDSLIAGAAQASGCRFLLSEDLCAGQNLDGVLVVNPFESEPREFGFP